MRCTTIFLALSAGALAIALNPGAAVDPASIASYLDADCSAMNSTVSPYNIVSPRLYKGPLGSCELQNLSQHILLIQG